jgi:hypothetical protein
VQAAFLYHFATFVEWLPEDFVSPTTPYSIGVVRDPRSASDSRFVHELEGTVERKEVNGRPFRIVNFDGRLSAELKHCHIVFVCPSQKGRVDEILALLKGARVLTVSEMDRFTQAGGMINFLLRDNKVRFEINDKAAKESNLRISSKLLRLARKQEGG